MIYVDLLDETNNCRMATEKTVNILHRAARILDFSPARFVEGENMDYYLLTAEQREKAISKGAVIVTNNQLLNMCGKFNQKFHFLDEEMMQAF